MSCFPAASVDASIPHRQADVEPPIQPTTAEKDGAVIVVH